MTDSGEKSWWEENVEDPHWQQRDRERALYQNDPVGQLKHDVGVGVEKGIYYGAKDMAVGLFEVAKWAVLLVARDPATEKATTEAVMKGAKGAWELSKDIFAAQYGTPEQKKEVYDRWSKSVQDLGSVVAKKVEKDWDQASKEGKQAELISHYISRVGFEAAALLVGAGEASAVAKASEATRVASSVTRAEKIGEVVAACPKATQAVDELSDAARAAKAIEEATTPLELKPPPVTDEATRRPTWRQSEKDAGSRLTEGYSEQRSFKDGKEVPYGTEGSTRPDWHKPGAPGSSVEVKNYDVQTAAGQQRLVSNVSAQAIERAKHLPHGTVQSLVIDVRGQQVSRETLENLLSRIATESNGIIRPENVTVLR